jgi:type I restriction enzyme R subunit
MSVLLDEIIADRKAKAVEYEGYLKRIADLAQKVEAGHADDTPAALDALAVDKAVKTTRPDSWRGVQPRENQVKKAIYDLLQDVDEVERIFVIIKAQKEY